MDVRDYPVIDGEQDIAEGLTLDEALTLGHNNTAYAVSGNDTIVVTKTDKGSWHWEVVGLPHPETKDVHVEFDRECLHDEMLWYGLDSYAAIWAPKAMPAAMNSASTLQALVIAVPLFMLACRFVKRYL